MEKNGDFLTEEIEENIFFDYIDLASKKYNKNKNIIQKLILNQINLKKKLKKSNHQKMKIKEDENFNDESQKDENSNNKK